MYTLSIIILKYNVFIERANLKIVYYVGRRKTYSFQKNYNAFQFGMLSEMIQKNTYYNNNLQRNDIKNYVTDEILPNLLLAFSAFSWMLIMLVAERGPKR